MRKFVVEFIFKKSYTYFNILFVSITEGSITTPISGRTSETPINSKREDIKIPNAKITNLIF
jgi:hypothetical protein